MLEEPKMREETDETCTMCADDLRTEGLEPINLIKLNPTIYKSLPVLVCPNCDGIV